MTRLDTDDWRLAASKVFREEAIARSHHVDDICRRHSDDNVANKALLEVELESVRRITSPLVQLILDELQELIDFEITEPGDDSDTRMSAYEDVQELLDIIYRS